MAVIIHSMYDKTRWTPTDALRARLNQYRDLVTPENGIEADMTPPERLRIWRRRSGLTQAAAAEVFGIHVDYYRYWEEGKVEENRPTVDIGLVTMNELCWIMRLRAKKTQREVAKKLKVSRLQVLKMEVGDADCAQLVKHWGIGK